MRERKREGGQREAQKERMEGVEGRSPARRGREADRWRDTGHLVGPSAAGPSHLALVSAPPNPSQSPAI